MLVTKTLVLLLVMFFVETEQAEENTNVTATTPETKDRWITKISVVIVESNRSQVLNYDRLRKIFDSVVNYTLNQNNIVRNTSSSSSFMIRVVVYLVSREPRTDNMAYLRQFNYMYMRRSDGRLVAVKSGSDVVTDVKELLGLRDPLIVWDTVERSVRSGTWEHRRFETDWETGSRGELMVWIAEDTSKYEPRGVYDQMVNRFGFKSVGLTDQELANMMQKMERSTSFLKRGVLEE